MPVKELHRFFLGIVFPSVLAIGLFILSIFVVIIPSFEKNIMNKKKEMISELTNTACSLIEEYNTDYQEGQYTLQEAKETAASRIKQIRYGDENKDYFWIIDEQPLMIMHPYRQELIGKDLSNYEDPNGKKLFVEAVKSVSQDGEGFINYMWQWKDDSTRIVPKLSYVQSYEPWGWIVGTGIYLEDVKMEIRKLKKSLIRISFFITIVIVIILSFVIRQSLIIENKRKDAEKKLVLSRQKYKSLVEASTEGTLMILNDKIIFSNLKFSRLIGTDSSQIPTLRFEDIFDANWHNIVSSFDDPKKTVSLETKIKIGKNSEKNVIISVSKIKYAGENGFIIITKEISQQRQIEKETEHLTQELQTSLLLTNQPIKHFTKDIIKCGAEASIDDAVKMMNRKKSKVIFVHRDNHIVGVINDSDLRKRVLAENNDPSKKVIEIMTSPVISIHENALLYEAILLLKNNGISHLGVKNNEGIIKSVISYEDIFQMQQNTVSFLLKEIEIAEDVGQLKQIYQRLPVLVNALIESGDKTPNITRIITSVSDAITTRIIELCIENIGKPPCGFAFMVMGSEGRMEQTLLTDQDNAIVFEDSGNEKLNANYKYFQQLGEMVSDHLDKVGYKLCIGGIMAKNPKWAQPFSVWREYFTNWITASDPQSVLEASIFFDFRSVYGNHLLIANLRKHVNKTCENKAVFFYHMAQTVLKFKPPLSLFGNIIGKNENNDRLELDIKKILFPITGFIRLYALYNKIEDTNSLSRIRQLYLNQTIGKSIYDELTLSYNYLMQLRFRFQAINIMQNNPPDNLIDLNQLTHIEIATLKKIFGEISNLQTKVNFDFKSNI